MELDEDLRPLILEQTAKIAEEKINRLDEIWARLFDQEIRQRHMKALLDHADRFYSDIVCESEERGKVIHDRIDELTREKIELELILGELQGEEIDPTLPLYSQLTALEKRLKKLRKCARDELSKTRKRLYEELEHAPVLREKLPIQSEIEEFKQEIAALMQVKRDRLQTIAKLRSEIENLIAKFSSASLCGNITALDDKKPTISNIESLECLRDDLISQYEELRRNISEARDRLKLLFSELNANVTDDTKFLLETDKISEALHQKLRDEVNFLEAELVKLQKRRKVKDLLAIWTSSALKSHRDVDEAEFRDFEKFCDVNKNIFALIEKRRSLWSRAETLQRVADDPSRFKNRGGKLLKEEQERKLIAKELPSIEAKLSQMVHQFEIEVEKKNNRKFTLFGEKVQSINERQYQAMRATMSPAHPKLRWGAKALSTIQHIVDSKRFNPLRY